MHNKLKNLLHTLVSEHGLLSLKAGTEWENMDYTEIEYLFSIGEKQVPILVKISGPEAKTDLRHLRDIGVNGILGPMIESVYALEKFVLVTQQDYAGSGIDPLLAINIETIVGYRQLDDLLASSAFQSIDTVVIGRLDLSLSMGIEDVDHPDVEAVTQDIAKQVRKAGKHVSVGGFVNPSSAHELQNSAIDRLSTIHTMFDLNQVQDAAATIWKAIEFEIAYYQALIERNAARAAFYQERIDTSQAKLDKATDNRLTH